LSIAPAPCTRSAREKKEALAKASEIIADSREVIKRADKIPRLELVQASRAFSFDGDGEAFRVASEAQRIKLAR
jgi:hypothetical protein